MTFIWPAMLWLLILVPVLIAAYLILLRRKRRTALRYASLTVVRKALGDGPGFRRHIPPLLFLAGLTVMIVAVARPAAIVTLPSQRGTVIQGLPDDGQGRVTQSGPALPAQQNQIRGDQHRNEYQQPQHGGPDERHGKGLL